MTHDLLPDLDLPPFDLFGEPVQTTAQPTPRVLRRAAKERFVRGLKKETLATLIPAPPAADECLHIVSNGTFDYFTFIRLILGWIGTADALYGSTWTINRANVNDLLKLYDEGKIRQISIVSGNYFLRRESAVAATLLLGLRERGQRFVTWENHAKVILLNNTAADAWYVVEGSANWTANPRTETNILLNNRAAWEFHRDWLEEMFRTVAPAKAPDGNAAPPRTGFSQRRAGLGVLSVHSDRATRDRVIAWKTRGDEDHDETGRMADELVALIQRAIPVRPQGCVLTIPPQGCVLTIPPQGASAPGPYFARALARRVANRLNMPVVEILQRTDAKSFHGRRASLAQTPYAVAMAVPAAIVVDDLLTSGTTMKLSLEALQTAGIPAWGFAYNGS